MKKRAAKQCADLIEPTTSLLHLPRSASLLMEIWKFDVLEFFSEFDETKFSILGKYLWDSTTNYNYNDNKKKKIIIEDVDDVVDVEEVRLSEYFKPQSIPSGVPKLSNLCSQLSRSNPDPHLLVEPLVYSQSAGSGINRKQPFAIVAHPQVGLLCDVHSHLCNSEVIGLLAGHWDASTLTLFIQMPVPCTATDRASDDGATDVELDPGAELEAREAILKMGMQVVGWYHSHPRFRPDPSITDISNQAQYQRLMRDNTIGIEPFVGLIIGSYDPALPTANALHRWFHVVPFLVDTSRVKKEVYVPMQLTVNYSRSDSDQSIATSNDSGLSVDLDEFIASPDAVTRHISVVLGMKINVDASDKLRHAVEKSQQRRREAILMASKQERVKRLPSNDEVILVKRPRGRPRVKPIISRPEIDHSEIDACAEPSAAILFTAAGGKRKLVVSSEADVNHSALDPGDSTLTRTSNRKRVRSSKLDDFDLHDSGEDLVKRRRKDFKSSNIVLKAKKQPKMSVVIKPKRGSLSAKMVSKPVVGKKRPGRPPRIIPSVPAKLAVITKAKKSKPSKVEVEKVQVKKHSKAKKQVTPKPILLVDGDSPSLLELLRSQSPACAAAREFVCQAGPQLRFPSLLISLLAIYYSAHPKRVDVEKKWKSFQRSEKIAISAQDWLLQFGLNEELATDVAQQISKLIQLCWFESPKDTRKTK